MQDIKTGEMRFITPEEKDKVEAEAMGKGYKPPPIFEIGEILEIKGGRFIIQSIGRSGIFLRGLPKIGEIK